MTITCNRVHISKARFINCTKVQVRDDKLRILLTIRYSGNMNSLQQKELSIIKIPDAEVKLAQ